jgi:hypothetical protein
MTVVVLTKDTEDVPTYRSAHGLDVVPKVLLLPEGIALPPNVMFCPEKGIRLFTLILLIVIFIV